MAEKESHVEDNTHIWDKVGLNPPKLLGAGFGWCEKERISKCVTVPFLFRPCLLCVLTCCGDNSCFIWPRC